MWSADGTEIVYSSEQSGTVRLLRKGVDSSGSGEVVLAIDGEPVVSDWSADGRLLLVTVQRSGTSWDQLVVSLDGEPEVRDLIATEFGEGGGRLSPDERWIAYQSESSGRIEIYVRPFPGPGRTLRASTAGGMWPRWSADGTEIFYQDLAGNMMAVPVRASGSGLALAPAVEVFRGPVPEDGWRWDVTADAGRFLVIEPATEQRPEPVTVLMNWPAVLDR